MFNMNKIMNRTLFVMMMVMVILVCFDCHEISFAATYDWKFNLSNGNGVVAEYYDITSVSGSAITVKGVDYDSSVLLVHREATGSPKIDRNKWISMVQDKIDRHSYDAMGSGWAGNEDFVVIFMKDGNGYIELPDDSSKLFKDFDYHIKGLEDVDTSYVQNMESMFENATRFNEVVPFDTSFVTNMSKMFKNASSYKSKVDLNIESATTIQSMFEGTKVNDVILRNNSSNVNIVANDFVKNVNTLESLQFRGLTGLSGTGSIQFPEKVRIWVTDLSGATSEPKVNVQLDAHGTGFGDGKAFKIIAESDVELLTPSMVQAIPTQHYTGSIIRPNLVINGVKGKHNVKRKLVYGKEYLVHYGPNNGIGTNAGYVDIKPISSYISDGADYKLNGVNELRIYFDIIDVSSSSGSSGSSSGGSSGGSSSGGSSGGSTNKNSPKRSATVKPQMENGQFVSEGMKQADLLIAQLGNMSADEALEAVNKVMDMLANDAKTQSFGDEASKQILNKSMEVMNALRKNDNVSSENIVDATSTTIGTVLKSSREKSTTMKNRKVVTDTAVDVSNIALKNAGRVRMGDNGKCDSNAIFQAIYSSKIISDKLKRELRNSRLFIAANKINPIISFDLHYQHECQNKKASIEKIRVDIHDDYLMARSNKWMVDFKRIVAKNKNFGNSDFAGFTIYPTDLKQMNIEKANLDVSLGGAHMSIGSELLETVEDKGITFVNKSINKAEMDMLSNKKTDLGYKIKLASNVFDIDIQSEGVDFRKLPKKVLPEITIETQIDKNGSALAVFNEQRGVWEVLPTHRIGEQYTARVPHFSKYAVVKVEMSFKDIAGIPEEEQIIKLTSNGILRGRSMHTFEPYANITRGEFAAYLVNVLGIYGEPKSSFKDVPADAWYVDKIGLAADYGIVKGTGDGNFNPNMHITRQDMIVMTANAYKILNGRPLSGQGKKFKDDNKIAGYAKSAVSAARYHKIIDGFIDGTFKPTKNATRVEALQIIDNLFEYNY